MGISLVTKAEYKAYAGLVSPNEDAKIDTLIPKVSALVKTICRRSFVDYVNDAKVEIHEGGASFLVPEEYPVLSVSSLEYSADFGKTYTELVEFEDYALSRMTHNIMSTSAGFNAMPNGYRLTYTAGFEVLPEDLKLAVFDLITYYMKNDMAVHSAKAPGTNTVQIEYVTTTNLPAHIKRVLDQYAANYS